jgi:predicted PurR-regulated permease PerM
MNAGTRWGLSALILMGVVFALYWGKSVFVPMVIALMLVAVLWPVTHWVNTTMTMPGFVSTGKFPWINIRLVRRQLPWGITVMIVIFLLVAMIVLVPLGLGMGLNNMIVGFAREAGGIDGTYQKFLENMQNAGLMPVRPEYKLTDKGLKQLRDEIVQAIPEQELEKLKKWPLKGTEFDNQEAFTAALVKDFPKIGTDNMQDRVVKHAKVGMTGTYKLTDQAIISIHDLEKKSFLKPEVDTKLTKEIKDKEAPNQDAFLAELSKSLTVDDFQMYRSQLLEVAKVPKPTAAEVPILQGLADMFNPGTQAFAEMLKNTLGYGAEWLVESVLIMFMLLFLLLEGKLLSQRLVEIFGPSAEAQGKAVKVLENMAEQVRIYLVWRTIVNFGLGLVLGILYWMLGLKFHWQWALLTALLCYIPYLGQIVAGLPPFLDALLFAQSSWIPAGPWTALAVIVVYVIIMTIEGYVIVPLVMGRSMQLNAITVLLACSFWFLVWGVPGLFLAMPLMAAVKAICANVPGWEAWANLMSTVEPEPKPIEPPAPPPSPPPPNLNDTEVMTAEEAQAHRAALESMQRDRDE